MATRVRSGTNATDGLSRSSPSRVTTLSSRVARELPWLTDAVTKVPTRERHAAPDPGPRQRRRSATGRRAGVHVATQRPQALKYFHVRTERGTTDAHPRIAERAAEASGVGEVGDVKWIGRWN